MKIADIKVDYIDHCGTDLSVVQSARVSFDKESDWDWERVPEMDDPDCGYEHFEPVLSVGDKRLINYLAKHQHFSPFNHTFITVRVKAPLYVARQMVKHEYMPWNEVSRRYVNTEPEFGEMNFRWAAENVKQGSGEEVDEMTQATAHAVFFQAAQVTLDAYERLLEMGICAEQARAILPVDMMTEWYWSGTLKAFHKMLSLRLDSHTQKESQIVAEGIKAIVQKHFPVSLAALLEHA